MNGIEDENLDFDLEDLATSGAAVTVVMFRPGGDRAVLVVAATDADRVQAMLGPQLPDRLCIVASRWTRAELDSVWNRLREHRDAWTVETISEPRDERAQASVYVYVLRVNDALACWAETLPSGLLTVGAALSPVRERVTGSRATSSKYSGSAPGTNVRDSSHTCSTSATVAPQGPAV